MHVNLYLFFFFFFFFFFNDTATTEIYTAQYTLSLHDALPICAQLAQAVDHVLGILAGGVGRYRDRKSTRLNSSHIEHLVCRLLLEKKKNLAKLVFRKLEDMIGHCDRLEMANA